MPMKYSPCTSRRVWSWGGWIRIAYQATWLKEDAHEEVPYCAEELQDAALACRWCGRDLIGGGAVSDKRLQLRREALERIITQHVGMGYLSVPVVASLFFEDVTAWLELHDIRFTPNVKFTGRSGYDHTFDFVVPASRRAPERLIRAVNRPGRDLAESLAFSWVDTREVRPPASKFYAFLNDEHRAPTPAIVDALRNYDIVPVVWSTREAMRQELAA